MEIESSNIYHVLYMWFGKDKCQRQRKKTGPDCSKLKMSLVNVLLKFHMLISEIRQYFLCNTSKMV